MELSLDSALSAGALVGHLSYFLLVLSMLMRRISTLRVLAISSALVGIAYDLIWLSDPVGVFWETMLLLVNVGQLTLMRWEDRRARFSPEESDFVRVAFPELPRSAARKLLDLGLWVSGEPGTVLTRQGESVQHLVYLASGEATIRTSGVDVAVCEPTAFVGEVTVLDQGSATATAVLTKPSRYWAVDAHVLRRAADSDPDLRRALAWSFSRNVRDKLVRSNARIAGDAGEASALGPGSS